MPTLRFHLVLVTPWLTVNTAIRDAHAGATAVSRGGFTFLGEYCSIECEQL